MGCAGRTAQKISSATIPRIDPSSPDGIHITTWMYQSEHAPAGEPFMVAMKA